MAAALGSPLLPYKLVVAMTAAIRGGLRLGHALAAVADHHHLQLVPQWLPLSATRHGDFIR